MRSYGVVLTLLVMLNACSPLTSMPGSTSLPTREPSSAPVLTPGSRMSDWIMPTDTQEVAIKMRALCCEDVWWDHLLDAESNGEEFDTCATLLKNLETAGERFDANEYFTILTHLTLEDGYVLDYVYFAPGGDGAPYLYAGREGEPEFADYSEYQEASVENYLSYIKTNGSAEGYYELAVLSIMGGQFTYLGILSTTNGK